MFSHQKNTNVEHLKSPVWCRLHALLGKYGESIMADLLTDCGIFSPLESEHGNYFQLSGLPLSELKPETAGPVASSDASLKKKSQDEVRKPGAISFVRNRMLYARAALNAKGGVRFGMRHIRK